VGSSGRGESTWACFLRGREEGRRGGEERIGRGIGRGAFRGRILGRRIEDRAVGNELEVVAALI